MFLVSSKIKQNNINKINYLGLNLLVYYFLLNFSCSVDHQKIVCSFGTINNGKHVLS